MSRILDFSAKCLLGCWLSLAMFVPFSAAHAQSFKVLYSFQGSYSGPDGAIPSGGLIADSSGNLYGVTSEGGNGNGTIFKIAPDGTESVLYAFKGGNDGGGPVGSLVEDDSGNLYGATWSGGGECPCPGINCSTVCGTVFKLASGGDETVLYAFKGESDGWDPLAGLMLDKHGNLYGTTAYGGNYSDQCGQLGCGTVFKLAPNGKKRTLYSFTGITDGQTPLAPLIVDKAGNLYGTTLGPNPATCEGDCGTVFRLAPDGTETVLYDFCQLMYCADGSGPEGGLIADKSGNLYGTTSDEGNVFKLAADGTETVLHSFDYTDGLIAVGSLVMDRNGNLYGATEEGGKGRGCGHLEGCGVIFKVASDGTDTTLHAFKRSEAIRPTGSLISINGYLYGTTESGGGSINCGTNHKGIPYGCGTVFAIKK